MKNKKSNENNFIMKKKIVNQFQRYVRKTIIVVNTLNFIIKNFIMMQQTFIKRKIREKLIDTITSKKKL